jgi:hypothetical protein
MDEPFENIESWLFQRLDQIYFIAFYRNNGNEFKILFEKLND